jgi:hypothetical protein
MSQSSRKVVSTPSQVGEPLVIQYTNLLHEYQDPAAPAVVAFVQAHQGDEVFLRRVEVLNKVFRLKAELVRPEL